METSSRIGFSAFRYSRTRSQLAFHIQRIRKRHLLFESRLSLAVLRALVKIERSRPAGFGLRLTGETAPREFYSWRGQLTPRLESDFRLPERVANSINMKARHVVQAP